LTFPAASRAPQDAKNAQLRLEAAKEFGALHGFLDSTFPHVGRAMTKTMVNKHSAIYHWKGTDSTQRPYLVYAHCDVVPVDDQINRPPGETQWSVDPFAGVIKDGYVWGRGAIDLKHMVVGWLEVFEDLASTGFQPKRDIYFAVGHDEEIGGANGAKEVAAWFAEHLGPDCFAFMWDEGMFVIDELIGFVREPIACVAVAEKVSSLAENCTIPVRPAGALHYSRAPRRRACVRARVRACVS